MKNILRGMMVISALTGALSLSAQTPQAAQAPAAPAAQTAPALSADEVVAKHLDAVGGKAAISQVKSISMDTTVQVMGNEVSSTTVIVDGVGSKTETEFNGAKIVQCYTDKGGWQVNPMAGAADPTPMSDDEYKSGKDGIFVAGGLYDYAAKGSQVALVPGDANTYKIKVTSKDHVESTYVLDATTFLVKSMTRKGQMQGQDVDITTSYSDYRKTDVGYLLPYAMDLDFGGQFSMSLAVKKVELNKTIDPAVFEMPKPAAPAAEAPKPDTTPAPKPN
jgi:hypothetical protein